MICSLIEGLRDHHHLHHHPQLRHHDARPEAGQRRQGHTLRATGESRGKNSKYENVLIRAITRLRRKIQYLNGGFESKKQGWLTTEE